MEQAGNMEVAGDLGRRFGQEHSREFIDLARRAVLIAGGRCQITFQREGTALGEP